MSLPQDSQDAQAADASTTQVQIDDSFESAAKASEASGDWLAAAGFWQSLLDRDPTNLEASLGLAENLRRLGQYDLALDVLRRALSQVPDDPQVLSLYGRTLVQSGDAVDAIDPLNRAAERDDTAWENYAALGVAFGMLNQPERAEEANLRALALSPDNPNVLNNMGLAAAMDGDLDGAIDLLERAAEHDEADVTVRQNLALLLAYRGDLARAEELARQDLPEDMADRNVAFYKSLSSDEVEQLEDLVNQSQLRIDEEPLAAPAQETTELALNDTGAPVATEVMIVVPEEEIVVPAEEILAAVEAQSVPEDNGEDGALAPEVASAQPVPEAAPDDGAAIVPQAAMPEPEAQTSDEIALAPEVASAQPVPEAAPDDGAATVPQAAMPESDVQASDEIALAPQRIDRSVDEVEVALPVVESVGVAETDEPLGDAIPEMMGSITAPAPEAGDIAVIEDDEEPRQRRSNDRGDDLPSNITLDLDYIETTLQPSEPIAVQGEVQDAY